MTSVQAILIGAAMIAASVLVTNAVRPAYAQIAHGPFMLMHHSNTAANAGVFRVDEATGEVSYCYLSGDGQLVCTASVH